LEAGDHEIKSAGPFWGGLAASTHAGAQFFCREFRKERAAGGSCRGLVVGFGKGHEAAFIADELKAEVVGIESDYDPENSTLEGFEAMRASVLDLPFKDDSFEFVFFITSSSTSVILTKASMN